MFPTVGPDPDTSDSDSGHHEPEPFVRDVQAAVGDWNRNVTPGDLEPLLAILSDSLDEFVPSKVLVQFEQSRAFLHDSAEYGWLLPLIRALRVKATQGKTLVEIRRTMLDAIDRNASSVNCSERTLHSSLPWNPFQFLK